MILIAHHAAAKKPGHTQTEVDVQLANLLEVVQQTSGPMAPIGPPNVGPDEKS
jgi:hypothetical protein